MNNADKILIVDDELDICYFLSKNLAKRNISTKYVHTLADAEKRLKEEIPSILLLDNHLPDGFGINFISKIKNSYPDMDVVMITAHDSSQDRAKAYGFGVDFFLSKPFTLAEVNSVIDLLLDNRKK